MVTEKGSGSVFKQKMFDDAKIKIAVEKYCERNKYKIHKFLFTQRISCFIYHVLYLVRLWQ